MIAAFDTATVNPGVRRLVRLLRAEGFETTDSGDGRTNIAAGIEGARDYPHVSIVVSPARLILEAHVLADLMQSLGVPIRPQGERIASHGALDGMALEAGPSPAIQASYDPACKIAILELIGVDDSHLPTTFRMAPTFLFTCEVDPGVLAVMDKADEEFEAALEGEKTEQADAWVFAEKP